MTVDGLSGLPDQDLEFISYLEDSMKRNFGRWQKVRVILGDARCPVLKNGHRWNELYAQV